MILVLSMSSRDEKGKQRKSSIEKVDILGIGKPSHPIQVKIMCALFILGRGTDLDTVSMLSQIAIGTISSFFHHFCEKMSSVFHEYIYMSAGDDLAAVTSLYTRMRFPGCVGSTDCVHFYWDRCPHKVRHLHLGKEGKSTVAYSLVADHTRRIRSLTVGNPGARNDKSISQYDKSIQDIRSKRLYKDEVFHLYDQHGQLSPYHGLYLLCDGGFHKWRIMQCPNKNGGVHLQENEVEIEDEWFTLRRNRIQHYNICFGLKQVEW